jgi:hypothetical protein
MRDLSSGVPVHSRSLARLPGTKACDTERMPKRQSRKPARDVNEAAFAAKQRVIALTEGEDAPARPSNVVPIRGRKNPAAVTLGRKGGLARAKTVMQAIAPERRRQIASAAARARWAKVRGDD